MAVSIITFYLCCFVVHCTPKRICIYIYIYIYIYVWDSFRKNFLFYNIIKYSCYKNDSRLNRYNFGMVNAIHFLFSPRHTTPLLYGRIDLGSCNSFVPVLQRQIPLRVQNCHIFWQEHSFHFKTCLYVEESSTY